MGAVLVVSSKLDTCIYSKGGNTNGAISCPNFGLTEVRFYSNLALYVTG